MAGDGSGTQERSRGEGDGTAVIIDTKVTGDPVGIRGRDPEEDWISKVQIQQCPDVQIPRGTDIGVDISRMGLGSKIGSEV
jgi:hypothetical protein